MPPRPPLDEVLSLFQASVAVEGTTTGAGAVAGNSFIDAGLIGAGANSFVSMLAIIYPGQSRLVDSMDITAFNNVTGEVTLHSNYKGGQIPAGVPYKIVTFRFVPAEVAALTALVNNLIAGKIEATGTADAGSGVSLLVDAARTEANHYWDGMTLLMITGNNAGIPRPIYEYMLGVGINVSPAFPNAIAAGDDYFILSNYHDQTYLTTYGAVNDAGPAVTDFDTDLAEATNDHYNGMLLLFLEGPNAGQAHVIDDYVGATKNVSFATGDQWTDVPVNGNRFVILPCPANLLRLLIASKDRQLFSMDFWSEGLEEVQIGDGVAGATVALPDITVSDLPAGATPVRAIVMFKFRMIENTYAGVNKLNGATVALTSQVIQIRSDAPTAYVDAINFVDDFFTLASSAREGGDVIIGQVDVAAIVDENDTYNLRWLLARADHDYLQFNDVQMGLRIWYSV